MVFLRSLCFIFNLLSFSVFFLFIYGGLFDLQPFPHNFFLTQSQNNVLCVVCAEELKIVCFYMITFIFKVVTLIFFVLAKYESKKMWS